MNGKVCFILCLVSRGTKTITRGVSRRRDKAPFAGKARIELRSDAPEKLKPFVAGLDDALSLHFP